MFYLWSSDKFSNFLKSSTPSDKVIDRQAPEIERAKKMIEQNPFVSDMLLQIDCPVERATLVTRDTSGSFYYLHYDKSSPVSIVFDERLSQILEVICDPKLLDKGDRQAAREIDYFALASEFLAALPPFPTIEKLIHDDASELYFIDTQEARAKHLKLQCEVFFEFIKRIEPKIKCIIYRQSPILFSILAQTRFDLSTPSRSESLPELFKEAPVIASSLDKAGRLIFATQNTPEVFEVIEIQETLQFTHRQIDALRLLSHTLLNLWRLT